MSLFKVSSDTNILISSADEDCSKSMLLNQVKGKETAASIHVGSRVVRGLDWRWDDQVKSCCNKDNNQL